MPAGFLDLRAVTAAPPSSRKSRTADAVGQIAREQAGGVVAIEAAHHPPWPGLMIWASTGAKSSFASARQAV